MNIQVPVEQGRHLWGFSPWVGQEGVCTISQHRIRKLRDVKPLASGARSLAGVQVLPPGSPGPEWRHDCWEQELRTQPGWGLPASDSGDKVSSARRGHLEARGVRLQGAEREQDPDRGGQSWEILSGHPHCDCGLCRPSLGSAFPSGKCVAG